MGLLFVQTASQGTLDSTCVVVGTALKIHDFFAIPIYGSMCYKAPPKDSSNVKCDNGTIIDDF